MTEAAFATQWPLRQHLLKVVRCRELAEEKGSFTAAAALLKQEGELERERAEAYRAFMLEKAREADRGDVVSAAVAHLQRLPEVFQDEIRAALGW